MVISDALMTDQLAPEESKPGIERTDIDSVMRRIFGKSRSDVHVREDGKITSQSQVSAPRRDFDTVIELLDRVSKVFELMVTRFQRLQTEFDVQAEQAASRAAEQDHAVEKWERLALDLEKPGCGWPCSSGRHTD